MVISARRLCMCISALSLDVSPHVSHLSLGVDSSGRFVSSATTETHLAVSHSTGYLIVVSFKDLLVIYISYMYISPTFTKSSGRI